MFKIINFSMKEMCLLDVKLGQEYVISKINLNEKLAHHLCVFGVEKFGKIMVLKHNYFKTSFLIKILNISYAIDRAVCEGIFVYV